MLIVIRRYIMDDPKKKSNYAKFSHYIMGLLLWVFMWMTGSTNETLKRLKRLK